MSGLDLTAILARYEAAQHYADKRLPALADIPALVEAVRAADELNARLDALLAELTTSDIEIPLGSPLYYALDALEEQQGAYEGVRYLHGPKPAPDLHEAADALWTALRNAKGEPFDPAILEAMSVYEEARGIRG